MFDLEPETCFTISVGVTRNFSSIAASQQFNEIERDSSHSFSDVFSRRYCSERL